MEPLHIQVDLPSCKVSLEYHDDDCFEVADFNEIQFPDFHLIKTIGYGSYGSVVACCFRGRPAAAKIFKSDIDHSYLLDEARHLHRLRHPNIISLYALFHGEKFGILFELMEGGSLNELLHHRKHITYQTCHVLDWSLQVCNALSYIHSHKFTHRDIKPSNMLLTSDYKILKLGDFGSIARIDLSLTEHKGTTFWMAPEVFEGTKYNDKCDIFSFGISLWEMMTRKPPFEDVNADENPFTILWRRTNDGLTLPKIDDLPKELMELIERCLSKNPDDRPCLIEIEKTLKIFIEIFPNNLPIIK